MERKKCLSKQKYCYHLNKRFRKFNSNDKETLVLTLLILIQFKERQINRNNNFNKIEYFSSLHLESEIFNKI